MTGASGTSSPSVSAAVAAATDQSDALSSYKRKLFFRKLKVALMALTGLTLLLLGCLLGFVLPATLEVKGQERGNLSCAEGSCNLNRMTTAASANLNVTSSTSSPSNVTSISLDATNSSTGTTSSSILLTVLTTVPPTTKSQAPKEYPQPKWWIPYIHDSMADDKEKRIFTEPTTTSMPNVSVNAYLLEGNASSAKPVGSTTSNTFHKLLVGRYREHAENELQKKHNATGTARPNVRRVTSYPQQNITTTPPSVVTRHVRSTA